VGRAANEYALEYAGTRRQGGRPIAEHQAVAMMLAEMAIKLDSARTQIWKSAWAADSNREDARLLGLLAKVNAADAAFEACRLATEVLGAAAIIHEHPVEKFLRDSVSFIHSDGTKQICLLRAAQSLSGRSSQPLFGF
jgi:acyl-CoA dehydrogenase